MFNRKILAVIGILAVILVLGCQNANSIYKKNKYYENYRMAVIYGDKEVQLADDTYDNWDRDNDDVSVADLMKIANTTLENMQQANVFESKYQHYVNEMIKYADADVEKQYAESMLTESKYSVEYNNVFMEISNLILSTNWNDQAQLNSYSAKMNDLIKNRDILDDKMNEIDEEKEEIRKQYPDFTKRLDQEYEASKNTKIM